MCKSSSFTISFLTFFLVLISIVQSSAQSPTILPAVKKKPPLHVETVKTKPGQIVQRIERRDGTSKDVIIDLTEQLSLIVELKDEPLFIQQLHSAGSLMKKSDPRIHLNQFRSDLSTLHQEAMASTKARLASPVIIREFSKVFSGVAILVPRAMVNQIAALSYVKKVHLNKQMHASLEQSVHQIRADSVWSEFGTKGDSVIVGEIDTGIDYTDSALGGGFGPAYKVIGGYNFIDSTGNPMDDNGHGTHVAGIIAANGAGLQGVAPHARLMAYKVLNQQGYGTEDVVIAGIEMAAQDHVDIVNMSLGGEGDPDDAISTAVDNAVQLGVVFCIAAGNNGSFNSIGSPGTARSAITVGAVDSTDAMAFFSSCGPNSAIYSIKPEIVAPGVNILSTYSNNSTTSLSGTSMATPHVTGVCALLKSLHRNWTPAQMKSAVMSSAIDIGFEAMVQGAGRIDALNAAKVTAFAVPSPISFGLDSSNFSTWNNADTVWISNISSQSQSFHVVFDGVRSGTSLTANPSTFTVGQNDSQQVIVSLSVNNLMVPYPQRGSLTYSGKAHFNGTKDTLNLPWAFVKAARILITSDIVAWISFTSDSFSTTYIATPTSEFICPNGVYDLMAYYPPQAIVLKERISVNGNSSIAVSSTDASHSIVAIGKSEAGKPLSSMPLTMKSAILLYPDSSAVSLDGFFGLPDTLRCSTISDRFTFYEGESATDGSGNYYNVQFNPLKGLNQNITLVNAGYDYRVANFAAHFPPSGLGSVGYVSWLRGSFFAFGVYSLSGSETKTGSYNAKMFFTKDVDSVYGFAQSLSGTDSVVTEQNWGDWFMASPPRPIGDSIGFFVAGPPPENDYVMGNGDTVAVGEGAMYTTVGAINNFYGTSNIYFSSTFFGQLDEQKNSTFARTHYTLYNSKGTTVAAGSSLGDFQPINVPPDEYSFVADNHDYYVNRRQGHAVMTAQFDLRNPSPRPPSFSMLRVLNQKGRLTDMLSTGEHGSVVFTSSINYSASSSRPDSTQVFFRENGTTTWIRIPVANLGTEEKADLSSTTQFDSAGIDLKFHIADQIGNSTEWVLEPAYGVGKFGGGPATVVNNIDNKNRPAIFTLQQNFPNPFNPSTQIDFSIPQQSNVQLKVYNTLGQLVTTLVNGNLSAGFHSVTFDARNLASGLYIYRLTAGNFTNVKKMLLLK